MGIDYRVRQGYCMNFTLQLFLFGIHTPWTIINSKQIGPHSTTVHQEHSILKVDFLSDWLHLLNRNCRRPPRSRAACSCTRPASSEATSPRQGRWRWPPRRWRPRRARLDFAALSKFLQHRSWRINPRNISTDGCFELQTHWNCQNKHLSTRINFIALALGL